jgi:hypothetical protein
VISGPDKGKYEWKIKLPRRFRKGKFYAVVQKLTPQGSPPACSRDTSKTIRILRRSDATSG